ncbi:prepilin-type N-terminal cleavage/methylation domain-containing protein [Salipiger aestuarii]|uniref:prepilin-type N-terminal cleavage/methylation domain-containing protein n=1 Tax=Salipiger aestuarii TaxID=568098 RepID=UPI001238BA1D|nr:prepilin-type N-terminal cleavage/methylation domain-containing protein [Salipiger aestuarii]
MLGRLTAPRGARGLTLLELVIAILVLSLGSLAALRATDQSRRAIGGEEPRLLARVAARNRAEELQLYGSRGPALPGDVSLMGQTIAIGTRTAATTSGLLRATVTARAASGEGAMLTVYLRPDGLQ